jgi:hypothetical protein
MVHTIQWETVFERSLGKATADNKPVFLNFFNPQSIDCQKMDEATYSDEAVIEFMNHNVVPLRIATDERPTAEKFNIHSTPALLLLDPDGKEHPPRTIGFLEAEELISSMLLGIGKMRYDRSEFKEAINSFATLLAKHPEDDFAPEATFLTGVSRFKSTLNPLALRETYEHLRQKYPQSSWTKRAYPYRLL